MLTADEKDAVLVKNWNGEANKANDELYRELQVNVLYKIYM